MKGGYITRETPYLKERDPVYVDGIVGKKRFEPADSVIDWSECPLAKAFPTWDSFHESLHRERMAAFREGRKPHASAAAPPIRERWTPQLKLEKVPSPAQLGLTSKRR